MSSEPVRFVESDEPDGRCLETEGETYASNKLNSEHNGIRKQHTLRLLSGLDCYMTICMLLRSRSGDLEFNKRRIGSVQSCNGFRSMAFADAEGSSRYHKLDWPLMDEPTIFSPSSFPQTSVGCQKAAKVEKAKDEPLKMMAFCGHQTLPKARGLRPESRYIRPCLLVRTEILGLGLFSEPSLKSPSASKNSSIGSRSKSSSYLLGRSL